MNTLTLYGVDHSPPVRAVKLTLHALELQYDFRLVNLLAGENKTKQFLRINPQHTVPVLQDGGHYIWDSHAIAAYLVRKYGKDDAPYPKEPLERAVVDQRLHFESGVLFEGCLRHIALPVFHKNQTEVPREKITAVYEAYDFLEAFLLQKPYLCGDTLTIADFSCVSTVSSLLGLAPLQPQKHARLSAWLQRMQKLPYYRQANGHGAQMLMESLNAKITKIV